MENNTSSAKSYDTTAVFGSGTAKKGIKGANNEDRDAPSQGKPSDRVHFPHNHGYVFTVRPEIKTVDKRDPVEEQMGASRMKLLKLTKEKRGATKDNLRAVQMDLSGRDKV